MATRAARSGASLSSAASRAGWVSQCIRGQVVDDDGAARLEQFLWVGRVLAAVQHQQVERGRPVDLAPVAGQHRQVGQIGEQGCDEPGPFGIYLDADQPGAGPCARRQPGQAYPAAGPGLADRPGAGGQGVQQAAVFGAAGVGEAQPAGEVDRALDQWRQVRSRDQAVVGGRALR